MSDLNNTATNSQYPRLLAWEVENFMSIKKGKVEFDDTNIINIKGYNDSGKSAMLTALKVLMTNANQTKQVSFIQDNADHFRIVAYFSGDFVIVRDKYRNGQSLYELYEGTECIFTTKQGNTLTKVSDVPEVIQNFLGLINYEKTFVNFRSCFEPQLGVQTNGSENYKMFNTVLKAEELATASTLLNNDKNKMKLDADSVDAELTATKHIYDGMPHIDIRTIEELEHIDNELNSTEEREASIENIQNIKIESDNIKIPTELPLIETEQITTLSSINNLLTQLQQLQIPPEVSEIDNERFNILQNIQNLNTQLEGIKIAPSLNEIELDRVSLINDINNMFTSLTDIDKSVAEVDGVIENLTSELSTLQAQMEELGKKMVKCPNCGMLFDPEVGHTDS